MADLASLRIAVDSREVRTARDDLLSLSGGAEKANKSVVSLGSGFNAIKGVIATLGLGVIAADIARANAEFQRLQAALTVATGSAGQASVAFNEIRKFAATTPYELNQSVEAFLRLKNLGLDPSIQSMRSYGNTASAMGKDLMQMVEAVADATTGEFERLKEFGIKASKAGDEVAFTFQGVTTTVKNNADAIQQYLLAIGNTQFAGGMEMQMQTLGGQFSNLKDNLDALYIAIGQAGANNALTQLMTSLSAAIVWATENIDLLTQVIGTAVTAFISYQATTIAIGVAISAYTAYTAAATAGTVAFTAALVANPAGAVAVAVAALAGAIFYLKNRTSELTDTTIVQSAEAKNLKDATEALNNVLADGSATDAAIASSRALVGQRLQEAKAAYEAAKAEVTRRNALANVPLIGGIMKLSTDKAKREMLDLQDAVMNGILNSIGLGKSSVDAMVTHAEKGTARVYSSGKKVREKSNADAERAARELAKSIADLNVGVIDGLHITMRETLKTMDALTKGDVVQMMDEINKRSDKRVKLANAETEARVKTNEELVKTVDYLDQVFGLDGNLGKLFGALKSGFSDVFDAIGGAFGGLRDSISNLLANLGTSFKQVAAGAAIGGIAAQAAGGSALGGTIGGGIGQALGSKFLSSALGSFAGPLGSIAGGLLGGLIGGLFSGTKQASATLSSIGGRAVVSSITGNNAQLKGVANNMATGLLKGIGSIAEQLGGQLGGAVSLSIGQRKKDFVVDPTGKGRTKGAGVINFGEDQAAAIAYATQLAIQQGIITGLSAGANALIKSGGDLQTQVEKAMKFNQVFKDLAAEADPLKAALDELNIELNKLRDIFIEAGASAADYAALEELYARRRAKTIFEAERPRRELEIALMEATGDTARALAAQRALELEAMDASLRGLQEQVWAAQDAAAANAELTASLESQAESIKSEIQSLMQEIASAVSDAENQLREAYNREVNALRELIQNFDTTANRLRDFSQSLRMMLVGPQQSLSIVRAEFERVARAARLGDMDAAGRLPEVGGALRDAVMANATSAFEAAREIAKIKLETDAATLVQDRQKTIAEQQLDELKLTVSKLIDVSENTVSVEDATKALADVQSAQNAVIADLTAAGFSDLITSTDKNSTAVERVKTATDRVAVLMAQLNDLTAQQNKLNAEQAAIAEKARQEAEARAAKALAASKEQWDALIGQGRGVASSRNVAEVNMVRQARELVADYIRFGNVQKGLNVVAPAEIARLKVWEATMPDALNRLASVSDQTIIEFAKQLAGTSTAGLRADLGSTRTFIDSVAEFNSAGTVFNDFVKQLSNIVAGLKDLQISNPGVFGSIPQFADGGLHSGGLRLVGENGPELEVTGPSRIYNANQVGSMLSGGSAAEEVKALRQEMKAAMYQIAKNTGKSYDLLDRWDGDGLPETRSLVA